MTPLPHSTSVSLTTFRRTGVPVRTPVWAASDGETLASGPAGAMRRCCRRGRVAGFVPAAEQGEALGALRRGYGPRFTPGNGPLGHRVLRRPGERHERLRIRPV
ncbi:MAG: class F420-dependent oxidoreductase [Blastococcus sp.]|nr:class F420-dependent oxidoreductase [Blastococcus sp.]